CDQRSSGIRNDRDVLTRAQCAEKFLYARLFIVFVIAHEPRRDTVVIQQLARLAGVFACGKIHFAEDAQRGRGNVLQIADRRIYDIQRSTHGRCTKSQTTTKPGKNPAGRNRAHRAPKLSASITCPYADSARLESALRGVSLLERSAKLRGE